MPNLLVRILSAAIILPPVISMVIFCPNYYTTLFIWVLCAISGFELASMMFKKSTTLFRVGYALFCTIVCASISFHTYTSHLTLLFPCFVFPLSTVFFMFSKAPLKENLNNSFLYCSGALYAGGLWGLTGLIPISSDNLGHLWILLLLTCTVFSDTFAYGFGRVLGKTKLAPKLSPGKTRAGGVGGILGSCIGVLVFKLFFLKTISWIHILLLGVPLSLFCQLGDLVESFIKRGFEVKDSGKIIPGHGGVLDRFDAFIFGAPIMLLYIIVG